MMRESITRYGRHNLGFMWLFLEPMLFTIGIASLWYALHVVHGSLAIIPFAVIGYSTVLLWRNVANRVGNAIEANTGLLYHRNVRVLDVYLARIFLEMSGATMSFLILLFFFIFTGFMDPPKDLMLMLEGWILLAWFAIGFGLCVGAIFSISEVVDRIWHALTYVVFPLSGAAFFVYWLPENYRKYILYMPMVHATEMIRHGYYGDLIPTFEDPIYFIKVNLVLSFVGISLINYVGKKIEANL